MQRKDCVPIKCCRLCSSKKINKVFDLGKTPLANSYSKRKLSQKLKKYPLSLNLCNNCGHLQLTHSIKPEKMFSNYLYKTNTSYKNFLHFKNYASEVDRLFKKKKGKILDIASNDGTFLNFFNKKKFFRLGIDPAKNLKKITKSKGILQIDNFFTDKFSNQIKEKFQQFDIITANHVCAHVENLNDFFLGVKNLLKDDGIFIFEISYRGSVLKKNTFDTIYHEHLDYHALFPISKFLKKFKLHLFNFKITEAQGGSLRIYASKNHKTTNQKKINNQIFKENHNRSNETPNKIQTTRNTNRTSATNHHQKPPYNQNAECTMVKVPEGRGEGRRPGCPKGSRSPLCVSTDFGPPGRPFGHA